MRNPSRFRHDAAYRGECRRCLRQRRSRRATHRKTATALQAAFDRHEARGDGAAGPPGVDAPDYIIEPPSHASDVEVAEYNRVIISESTTALKPLSSARRSWNCPARPAPSRLS